MAGLPHIDDHALPVPRTPAEVYPVLRRYAGSLGFPESGLLTRLWGTEPASGFAVVEEVPGRLVRLAGRHRFSRYELVFDLTDSQDGGSVVRARSYATFPGVLGRAYRAAVIGSGAHVVVTRRLLREVRRRATAAG